MHISLGQRGSGQLQMKKNPVRHQTQNEINEGARRRQTEKITSNNSMGSLSNTEDGNAAVIANVLEGFD
jgi:hypothetical protein